MLLSALGCAGLALCGCSAVRPHSLTNEQIRTACDEGLTAARKEVAPITKGITYEEAIARAFKYNLAHRAKLMEQAMTLHTWKAGNIDMLPRALATAGYRNRNKDLITRSQDSVTGQPSLAHPYISSEREYETADLGFSWSVLDFTVGYYTAKQNADRVLIAAEHRRRAMNILARDVSAAFWRMACAQRLLQDVRQTIGEAEAALADAAKAKEEGIKAPAENLRYQRQLLENIRMLSGIEKDFSVARLALATLINAPVNQEFSVVEPEGTPSVAILDVPASRMEELALHQNAELREHMYNERIAAQEVRKSIARVLPNLSFTDTLHHSSDSFLINNTWNEAGLLLSQNLTGLLSAPANYRAAKTGVAVTQQRRLAAQMALLAQVHVARLELASAHTQLKLSDKVWALDQELARLSGNRQDAQAESRLSRIAANTANIVSMLRRYQALSDFNTAAGNLKATLGLQIDIAQAQELPLADLTKLVAERERSWLAGKVPEQDTPTPTAAAN